MGPTAARAGRRHPGHRPPGTFPLLLARPAITENAVRPRDITYPALRDAGIPEALLHRTETLLSTFVLGFAASEVGGRFSSGEPGSDDDHAQLDDDFDWALDRLSALVRATAARR